MKVKVIRKEDVLFTFDTEDRDSEELVEIQKEFDKLFSDVEVISWKVEFSPTVSIYQLGDLNEVADRVLEQTIEIK
jgi:hypothetical protein